MQELKISEYSFHEFLSAFQEAVIDGFRLDLESNERFPQKYGSHLEVTLVQPLPYVPLSDVQAEIVEPKVKARKLKEKVESEKESSQESSSEDS
jgi:hypothetical protein